MAVRRRNVSVSKPRSDSLAPRSFVIFSAAIGCVLDFCAEVEDSEDVIIIYIV